MVPQRIRIVVILDVMIFRPLSVIDMEKGHALVQLSFRPKLIARL
jgi:hypothetical protein